MYIGKMKQKLILKLNVCCNSIIKTWEVMKIEHEMKSGVHMLLFFISIKNIKSKTASVVYLE